MHIYKKKIEEKVVLNKSQFLRITGLKHEYFKAIFIATGKFDMNIFFSCFIYSTNSLFSNR